MLPDEEACARTAFFQCRLHRRPSAVLSESQEEAQAYMVLASMDGTRNCVNNASPSRKRDPVRVSRAAWLGCIVVGCSHPTFVPKIPLRDCILCKRLPGTPRLSLQPDTVCIAGGAGRFVSTTARKRLGGLMHVAHRRQARRAGRAPREWPHGILDAQSGVHGQRYSGSRVARRLMLCIVPETLEDALPSASVLVCESSLVP